MTSVTVREMKKSDLSCVIEIMSEGVTDGTSTFRASCPNKETWDSEHLQCCRFVADANGVTAGYCALAPYSKREEYRGIGEVSVYIAREYRHRGVGEKLLKALIEESEREGFWCLTSNVFASNTASVKLHEAIGFRLVGVRKRLARDIFGEWQNVAIFERRVED